MYELTRAKLERATYYHLTGRTNPPSLPSTPPTSLSSSTSAFREDRTLGLREMVLLANTFWTIRRETLATRGLNKGVWDSAESAREREREREEKRKREEEIWLDEVLREMEELGDGEDSTEVGTQEEELQKDVEMDSGYFEGAPGNRGGEAEREEGDPFSSTPWSITTTPPSPIIKPVTLQPPPPLIPAWIPNYAGPPCPGLEEDHSTSSPESSPSPPGEDYFPREQESVYGGIMQGTEKGEEGRMVMEIEIETRPLWLFELSGPTRSQRNLVNAPREWTR